MLRTVVLLGLALAATACPDKDLCANNDCGSCGNACCNIDIAVSESTEVIIRCIHMRLCSVYP